MVDAIISFAIENLGEFIEKEVNILVEVKDNVRWLRDELRYLQPSVRYAESRQEEELIRNWVNDVRDVSSDAVTILSDFNAHQKEHAAPKQGILDRVRACACMFRKEVMLYDIGKEIESLKDRISIIKNRRTDYRIDNILATPNVQQTQRTLIRTTAIYNQVDVVGFEDDFKTLKAELDSEDLSLKVISIHGMGGLGKTSLATKLYNCSELRHFDTRVKVCVSNEYNIKNVLKRMVKSFMGPEHEQYMSTMDEHDLLEYLPKLLQERGRYLALIDDIWDRQVLDQIKIAFPKQNNGSRIIITTRNQKVAEILDDKCYVHQLRFLTKDESWQLFCKRAEPATPDMEKLGREMVGKCRGLPLAIVILSSLLLHNRRHDYWPQMKDHIWRQLKEGGSSQIEEILSLSYNDLSTSMRDCFLYLARYPEDHVIESDELKRLWIAEEFILEAEEGEGVVMEDLAENYLNELISRNLIQVESLQLNGQVLTCRVHDLVHDLAKNKAKEHKLLAVFDLSKDHQDLFQYYSFLEEQPRHVIYNGLGEYLRRLKAGFDASNLHSLALVKYFSGNIELKQMELMCNKIRNLKVLDMRSVDSERIPEEIGDLVLLKYLGLMGGETFSTIPIEIPPSIRKLKKLQTLLGSKQRRYTVPTGISELHELRYLNIQIIGSLDIGNHQTKIHTLGTIQLKEWIKIDTVTITNLHALYIEGGGGGDGYTLESISKLTSLQTFSLFFISAVIPTIKPLLSCDRLKNVRLTGPLNVPQELRFLPHSVTDLGLSFSGFTEDPMPTLGSLSNLTALELYDVYRGNKMVCSHGKFPSLQILRLNTFPYLEELEVEDGAFPSLRQYQERLCGKLKKIPVQLERFWVPYL